MSDIITLTGLRLINRAFEPDETLRIKYIVITDDTATAANTDTLATFCDRLLYNYEIIPVTDTGSDGSGAYFIAQAGSEQANWQWKKIGIVDENMKLIAISTSTYTKASPERREVSFYLEATA